MLSLETTKLSGEDQNTKLRLVCSTKIKWTYGGKAEKTPCEIYCSTVTLFTILVHTQIENGICKTSGDMH